MRKCPRCGKANQQLRAIGWILKVDTSVLFDSDGEVVNVAPLNPIVMVKTGKEMDSPYVKMCCGFCDFKGRLEEFTPIASCWITGQEATDKITIEDRTWHISAAVDVERLTILLQHAAAASPGRDAIEEAFNV